MKSESLELADAQSAAVAVKSPVVAIARACHEVNRAYCESQGDHSQPSWEAAPDWQRQSAVTGVLYALGHPDAKPADSHESWLAEKRRDGWSYGPVKDPEAKNAPVFRAVRRAAPGAEGQRLHLPRDRQSTERAERSALLKEFS